jgi:primary-amine oxidase
MGAADTHAQRGRVTHHFAQPTEAELRQAIAAMKADSRWPANAQIITIGYRDQPKDSLRGRTDGSGPRAAQAVVYAPQQLMTYEITVNLRTMRVSEVVMRNDVHPLLTAADERRADSVVRAHAGWLGALERRGLRADVVANVIHASGSPINAFRQRLLYVTTYEGRPGAPMLDKPVSGLRCLVDVTNARVMLFIEPPLSAIAPLPRIPAEIKRQRVVGGSVAGRKPWTFDGGRFRWKEWSFAVMMSPQEGPVLYDVRRSEGSREQSVAWRVSVSELLATQNDTTAAITWKHEFLVGEHGIGAHARTLVADVDVPASAQLLSMATATEDGTVRMIPAVMAVYERDALNGSDLASMMIGGTTTSNELVITARATIAHHDITISYILHADGAITVDVGAGGTPWIHADAASRTAAEEGQCYEPMQTVVACLRMDMDVAGVRNAVTEVDRIDQRRDVLGRNGRHVDVTEFRFEQEARRNADPDVDRYWMIRQTASLDSDMVAAVETAAYVLEPSPQPHVDRSAWLTARPRAHYAAYDCWTTVYQPSELFAAGPYPNQAVADDGLKKYIANNQPLHGRDLVLWHTLPIRCIPGTADRPRMVPRHGSVTLRPVSK